MTELRLLHPSAPDLGAVRAAKVTDLEPAASERDLRVAAGDRGVGDLQRVPGPTADGEDASLGVGDGEGDDLAAALPGFEAQRELE